MWLYRRESTTLKKKNPSQTDSAIGGVGQECVGAAVSSFRWSVRVSLVFFFHRRGGR